MRKQRIAVIGLGHIGNGVCQQILAGNASGAELVFAADTDPANTREIPENILGEVESDLQEREPDLVLEAAHRSVTAKYGAAILKHSDYLPISLTALADRNLFEELHQAAEVSRTRVFLPHGAATGIDGLFDGQPVWEDVRIETEKHVDNLRFDDAPELYSAELENQERVIFSGSARQACARFPANLNAHAAIALSGVGFDRTTSLIKSSKTPGQVRTTIQAKGGGRSITIDRTDEISGVSGASMINSVTNSLSRALSNPGESYWC